ncbi:uncharacterized protein ISCGN_018766 [Ixodes scapularis]
MVEVGMVPALLCLKRVAVDKWPADQIRLEAFFEGNGVTDVKKKRALLVAALSTSTVDVISGRCAPAKVNELPYSEVVDLLQQHFSPKLIETAQSYKFFSRNQLPGEPVRDFVVAIRQIADTSNFGDTLDRMLRDRIVCGLQNSMVRRQLVAKPFLTRTEAEEIAVAAEMAEKNVKEIQRATMEDGGVHAVGSRTPRQKWRETESPCSRCGRGAHQRDACRFRMVENHPQYFLNKTFCGPVDGFMLLVVVDSHTKKIEAVPMKSANGVTTVEALRTVFSTFGLPETIVSDNGPQFTCEEFGKFLRLNNIVHLRTAPYHTQSNGLAKRAVHTVKQGLKKNKQGSLQTRLARGLHRYRRTPSAGGKTPAMQLMGYELRSRLDNAVVPPPSRVGHRNDTYTNDPVHTGEPVWVRNFGRGEPWAPARVQSMDGARMVTADGNEGDVLHRHLDQVKPRLPESLPESAPSPPRLPQPEATPGLQQPTRTRRAPVRFSP